MGKTNSVAKTCPWAQKQRTCKFRRFPAKKKHINLSRQWGSLKLDAVVTWGNGSKMVKACSTPGTGFSHIPTSGRFKALNGETILAYYIFCWLFSAFRLANRHFGSKSPQESTILQAGYTSSKCPWPNMENPLRKLQPLVCTRGCRSLIGPPRDGH